MNEALALDVTDLRGRIPKVTVTVRRRGESHRVALHLDSAHALRRCAAGRREGPLFTSGRSSSTAAPRRLTRFGADHLIRQLGGGEEARRVTANAFRRFHLRDQPGR
jgi:integrase